MSPRVREKLWKLGLSSIHELESDVGLLASARTEVYGCVFGRDSALSALMLLRAYQRGGDGYFLALIKKILGTLCQLQGREVTIDSGEEPGKIIHEYRTEGHEHLTQGTEKWYLYPDNVMRNYDSVDSTPLFLMAMHSYLSASGDESFIREHEPSIKAALNWMLEYGDKNGDGFIDYEFHHSRQSGGLRTQSWMDSTESLFYEEEDTFPVYPIAPVEVQAYAFAALRMWSRYFRKADPVYADRLDEFAHALKEKFNQAFVLNADTRLTLAFALDGTGRPLTATRSSMGHVLWAASVAGETECILNREYIEPLRKRLLSRDMFVSRAGIRTLSSRSPHYDPVSYHNGSIWPHDTAMLAQGLEHFGYTQDAGRVRRALVCAYRHFQTPIELFGYAKGFREYTHPGGAGACRVQAWSAASLLAILGSELPERQ